MCKEHEDIGTVYQATYRTFEEYEYERHTFKNKALLERHLSNKGYEVNGNLGGGK